MKIVRLNPTLIEFQADDGAPKARINAGPLRKTKIATQADFDAALRLAPALDGAARVAPCDKDGKPIVVGAEMAYLDRDAAPVWHVYELAQEDWAGPDPKWRRRGWHESEAEAAAHATQIAIAGGA